MNVLRIDSNLEKQFQNPIVYMDNAGNGYCRIDEVWDKMSIMEYVPEDDVKAPMAIQISARQEPGKAKKGEWTKEDRKRIRQLIIAGETDAAALARMMGRTVRGIKIVANHLIKEQIALQKSQACKAVIE